MTPYRAVHIPHSPQWPVGANVWIVPTDPFNTDISTVDTIHRMIQLVNLAAKSPAIHSVVQQCKRSGLFLTDRSKLGLCRACYWWVKNHVRFEEDEEIIKQYLWELGWSDETMNSIEGSCDLLISPELLVSMPEPVGDCDDFSMLLAAMLTSENVQCSFVVIAADRNQPERFSHVFVKAFTGDGYLPLDASHGQYPGWRAKGFYRIAEWSIE